MGVYGDRIAERKRREGRRRRARHGKAGFDDAGESGDDSDDGAIDGDAAKSAAVATNDATSTSTSTSTSTTAETETAEVALPPMPPVDREWLRKLLRRHARACAVAPIAPAGEESGGRGGIAEGDDDRDGDGDAEDEKKTDGDKDGDGDADALPCRTEDDDGEGEKQGGTCDNPYPPPIDPTVHALAVAPMVDQSDLPFRLLCRKYGANLAYTPMAHARLFLTSPPYRTKFWNCIEGTPAEDRPLIVQFCGGDADVMLAAAKLVEDQCDAVDVNCGCPQFIARRGNYGAFLLEQESRLINVVRTMAEGLSCPVTVKVRLLPSGVEDSIQLYSKLIDAGAAMLTVHGRTRHMVGGKTGRADWDALRRIVDALGHRVPILSNGSICSLDEAAECLAHTGADGVMSSEAVLEYPALFSPHDMCPTATGGRRTSPSRVQLAREYMELAEKYPPAECGQGSRIKCPRMHLHKMLHADLQRSPELRDLAIGAQTIPEIWGIVDAVERYQAENGHDVSDEELSWYVRHRIVDEATGINVSRAAYARTKIVTQIELDDDVAEDMGNMFGEDW